MDRLTTRFTGFGIDDFAKEFAEFEICVEVLCGDGEEGVFAGCGGGCVGGGGSVVVFKGDFFDCAVYIVEVGG